MSNRSAAAAPGGLGASLQTDSPTERDILLILGMHRSGTSALSGALCKLGGGAPKTLYGAFPSNLKGHWESEVIFRFNDRMLEARGRHWNDWRAVPGMGDYPECSAAEMAEAVELLESEYGDARFPVVKDPRMCRLMAFWLEAFRQWGGKVHIVMPLRSPLEVALSQKERDRFRMPILAGLQMWQAHVLYAEKATRGLPRLHVGWERFMSDWRSVVDQVRHMTDHRLPQPDRNIESELDAFLTHDLRHHRVGLDALRQDPRIPASVIDCYEALIALQNGEDPAIHRRLDDLLSKFEETSGYFYLYNQEHIEIIGELQAELSTAYEIETTALRQTIANQSESIRAYEQTNNAFQLLVDDYKKQINDLHKLASKGEEARLVLAGREAELFSLRETAQSQLESIRAYAESNELYQKLVDDYSKQIYDLHDRLGQQKTTKRSFLERNVETPNLQSIDAQAETIKAYVESNMAYQKLVADYVRQIEDLYKRVSQGEEAALTLASREVELQSLRQTVENQNASIKAYAESNEAYQKLLIDYRKLIMELQQERGQQV
jgi:hypothetical protein